MNGRKRYSNGLHIVLTSLKARSGKNAEGLDVYVAPAIFDAEAHKRSRQRI